MRILLRAALAGALLLPATPASATNAAILTCTVGYPAGGGQTGYGSCTVSGVVDDRIASGVLSLTFAISAGPLPCPLSDTASGYYQGTYSGTFRWTRVGGVAAATFSGPLGGSSVAVFGLSQPVGNPCGGPVSYNPVFVIGSSGPPA